MFLLKAQGENLSHASSSFWWLPEILDVPWFVAASLQPISIFTWSSPLYIGCLTAVPYCLSLNVENYCKEPCHKEWIKVRWQLEEDKAQREGLPLFSRCGTVESGWILLGMV